MNLQMQQEQISTKPGGNRKLGSKMLPFNWVTWNSVSKFSWIVTFCFSVVDHYQVLYWSALGSPYLANKQKTHLKWYKVYRNSELGIENSLKYWVKLLLLLLLLLIDYFKNFRILSIGMSLQMQQEQISTKPGGNRKLGSKMLPFNWIWKLNFTWPTWLSLSNPSDQLPCTLKNRTIGEKPGKSPDILQLIVKHPFHKFAE